MTPPNNPNPRPQSSLTARIVTLYTDDDNPKTIVEISRELGIGRETVREHLIRANVPRRAQKARGSRDEAMISQAVLRYREGETLWAIATDLGKTATTVRSWLMDAGVERRQPGVAVDRDSLNETIELYESGMTIDEVAHEQGLHPWTVRQRLINAGVPRRARGRRPKQRRRTPVEQRTMLRREPYVPPTAEDCCGENPLPGSVGGLHALADALDHDQKAAALDARILASDT